MLINVLKDYFFREIQGLKALRHSNIVKFRDAGCWGGILFFTMEYCDRGNVNDLMKEYGGVLPEKNCFEDYP